MSLSTLLEAAKYLDYLDSSNNQQQQQQQQGQQTQFHQTQQQPLQIKQKSSGRRRISKKNAANTMLAMSLNATSGMRGVPIPVVPGSVDNHHHAASLSSSFTTGSPLSSFASTALFCSKASGVTSASSSAASSLSSSDSTSSCGEILMGDNDFNQSPSSAASNVATSKHSNNINNNNNQQLHIDNISNNNHHNYHLINLQQQFDDKNKQLGSNNIDIGLNKHQSIARYIAATSNGPQLVTMTTNSAMASASAPIDGNIRAGHVIHAAHGAILNSTTGTSFDSCHHISLPSGHGNGNGGNASPFATAGGSYGSDSHLSGSPGSCPPLIMARVQPMMLNSLSPSTQSIMAFQPATASSPTSSSSSYSRHRELHKTLEKNRRAHLRHCFELLKAELPASECVDKKTSHINIIKSAIRYVLALRQQECEIDNELQRLTKKKMELTENLTKLRINDASTSQSATSPSSTAAPSPSDTHAVKQEHQQLQQQQSEHHQQQQQQIPASEQQLSFLLSKSKIDN